MSLPAAIVLDRVTKAYDEPVVEALKARFFAYADDNCDAKGLASPFVPDGVRNGREESEEDLAATGRKSCGIFR
jgi:hypothetical protein